MSDNIGATASPQPAGHASHGAAKASPPFGDHQAQRDIEWQRLLSRAVEAAYFEGWNDGYQRLPDMSDEQIDKYRGEDWDDSLSFANLCHGQPR